MNDGPEALVVLPLVVLVPAAIIFLISRLSGWNTLADRHPLLGTFPKPKTYLGYAVFRGWVGYNGGVIVGSDSTGLYLKTWPVILSFCHAPIYIPWSEIREIEPPSGWLGGVYRIRTARLPELDFGLRPGTFDVVREDAQQARVPGKY